MAAKDRRECVRLSTSRSVIFVVKGLAYRGSIENNCDSGVFIKIEGRFSEGQDISMTIKSPKLGSEKRTGKIARVTPEGIGVEFNYLGYTR